MLILRHLWRHRQGAAGDVFPSLRRGICAENADLGAARLVVVGLHQLLESRKVNIDKQLL